MLMGPFSEFQQSIEGLSTLQIPVRHVGLPISDKALFVLQLAKHCLQLSRRSDTDRTTLGPGERSGWERLESSGNMSVERMCANV